MGGCGSTCLSPPDIPANPERIDLTHFEQLKVVGQKTHTHTHNYDDRAMHDMRTEGSGCNSGHGPQMAGSMGTRDRCRPQPTNATHRPSLWCRTGPSCWMAGKGGFGKVNAITRKFDGSLMALKRMAKCEVSARVGEAGGRWAVWARCL